MDPNAQQADILKKVKDAVKTPQSPLVKALVTATAPKPNQPQPKVDPRMQAQAVRDFDQAIIQNPRAKDALEKMIGECEFKARVVMDNRTVERSFLNPRSRDVWLLESAEQIQSVESIENKNVTLELAENAAALLFKVTGDFDRSLLWVQKRLGISETRLMESMLEQLFNWNPKFLEQLAKGRVPVAAKAIVEGKRAILKGAAMRKLMENNSRLRQWVFEAPKKTTVKEAAKKGNVAAKIIESISKQLKREGLRLTEGNIKSLLEERNVKISSSGAPVPFVMKVLSKATA